MKEVKEHPVLTKEQEKQLWIQWKKHKNKKAFEKLILSFQPLLYKFAKTYCGMYEPLFDDLVQAGNVAVLEYSKIYSPYKNTRFVSYAYLSIKREIYKAYNRYVHKVDFPIFRCHEISKKTEYLPLDELVDICSNGDDVITEVSIDDINDLVENKLLKMEPKMAHVIYERIYLGKSYKQISKEMKLPRSTVQGKYYYGIELLRMELLRRL